MTEHKTDSAVSSILIVDDKPENLRLLSGILKEQGYEIRLLRKGNMAMSSVLNSPPDLIMLDIMMPETDGYEVCRQLKADERSCNIPVVFISALNEVVDKVKAFSVGGVDYISKPFHAEEVLARVKTHLTISHLQQQVSARNMQLQREIAEHQKTSAALQEREEKLLNANLFLDKIINTLPNPVFVKDEQHRWLILNDAFCDFMGYRREQLIGKSDCDFFPKEQADVFWKKDNLVFESNTVHSNEESFTDSDGKLNTILTKKSAMTDINGEKILVGIITDITERKKMENDLRESEEQYRNLVENLSEALFMTDIKGFIIYISPIIEAIIGLKPEEIIGKHLSEFIYPEDLPMISDKFQKIISEQESEPSEVRSFHKNGNLIWIRTSSSKYVRNGVIAGLQGVVTDITIRKDAEEALKRSNSVLKAQQEASVDGILTVNENKKITDYNQKFIEIWNIPDNIVKSQDDKQLLRYMLSGLKSPDIFLNKVRYLYDNILDIGQDEIETTDGRTFDWYCGPIMSSENQYLGKIWFFRDITDRKRTEQALLEGEEKYRNLVENINDVVYILDPKGFFIYISPIVESVTGFSPEEVVGKHMSDFMYHEDMPILYDQFKRLLSGQKAPILEYRFLKKSGEVCWGRTSNRPKFKDGAVESVHGLFTDITERKQAEEALKESERLMSDIINFLPDATIVIDRHGRVISWNRAMEDMTGIKAEDMLGKDNYEYAIPFYGERRPILVDLVLKPVSDIEKTYPSIQRIGDALIAENHYQNLQGKEAWLIGKASLLLDSQGEIIGAIESVRNITDKKFAEEELLKAKEAAETANRFKSDFLSNMSHEIRTPMNAIMGFTELLSSLIEDRQQKSYLDAIQTGGKSLLTLINDILDLSKIEAGKLDIRYEPVSPHDIFNEVRQIFAMRISQKNLEFISDIAEDIPESLMLDEVRLRQVLFNLIGNAVKFTEEGYVKISACVGANNYSPLRCDLIITVEDTGIGVPPESQDRIFEAFMQQEGQSAKKYGGTGLGLAITKRLVEMMNGEIVLESAPGRGSIFRITLHNVEVVSDKTVSEAGKSDEAAPENFIFEPATILVVDDMQFNRFLLKAFFNKTDISVIEAEDGQQAVRAAEEHKPDLILMDISMPVMDGYEAVRQIRHNAMIAAIPVIALTARAMSQDKEHILSAGFDGYLAKPVKRAELFDELSRFISYAVKEKISDNVGANNYSPLPETLEKISEIIHRLENEFQLLWENARESGNFADIEDFANRIRAFGEQYSLASLINLGKNLLIHVGNFDIDNIEAALNYYPKRIEEIRIIR